MRLDGENLLCLLCLAYLSVGGAAVPFAARAADRARAVVAAQPGASPKANDVAAALEDQLGESDIPLDVALRELPAAPANRGEWIRLAKGVHAEAAGTVALLGYACEDTRCRVTVVEPRRGSFVELPVDAEPQSATAAIASVMREALIGTLLPEIDRLVAEGERPTPPPTVAGTWLKPPLEEERKRPEAPPRPWLWLEGGYHGDYGHPDGKPIHGPWLGLVFEPRKMVGAALCVGWLGIEEDRIDPGTATVHRFTTALALRVIFSLGPAHVAVAPVGRLDVTFVDLEPVGRAGSSWSDLELQAGGLTTWHLPLTPRIEAVVGAGVVASILAKEIGIYGAYGQQEVVVQASVLRLWWLAGIAWSPLKAAGSGKSGQ